MRRTYRDILKQHFHIHLVHIRIANGMTQSEMAEKLAMDDRSYIDLDHGKTCLQRSDTGVVPRLCLRRCSGIFGGIAPCV